MSGYQRLTHEELYELVWSTPATKLGERFGVAGRGLAKLCERYGIPVPERGWWAKKAAGHKLKQPTLPPAKTPGDETIELYIRDDFRQWLTPEDRDFFEKRLAEELSAAPTVVPEADDSRHPLIVRSRKKHRDTDGPLPLHLNIAVSDALRDRALRLATALVNACEARRYTFEAQRETTNGVAEVCVFGQLIGISIAEPSRRVPHTYSRRQKRDRKRSAAVGRSPNTTMFRAANCPSFSTIMRRANGGAFQAVRSVRSRP